MSTRLDLFLLGPPEVILPGGSPAVFAVQNSLLLLAYLALEPQKPSQRNRLAAWFYPDHAEKQASQNVRKVLFRLRQAIGDCKADPTYLLCTPYTLQFNAASNYWLDVAEFETLIAATQQHRHRRLEVCQDCMAKLAQAVELYRGELLRGVSVCKDTPLEDWLFVAREGLRRKVVNASHTLAQYHYDRGQFDLMETYTARLLLMDELDEVALRQQMQVLALKGARNQALRHYQEFKRKLAAELEVEPEPETIILASNIRAGRALKKQPGPPQRPNTLLTCQPISTSALPNTLVPFVGRETELGQIAKQLASRDCRLLTLVGPGGSGKTRLAMRAAADDMPGWAHGVWIAVLDDGSTDTSLETALVNALGISITNPAQTRMEIYNFLHGKELLLILDNFERVIAQADLVKSLLHFAPTLKVIVTSRERLGIRGEQVIQIEGLDFPESDGFVSLNEEELAQWTQDYSAVQLFVENAHRVKPSFALSPQNVGDIVRICQLVDGLPLAIEMASAWVRIFPCDQILARIEQSTDFLKSRTKDVPPRQASFRAVFEYSWKLLTEEERELLRKLAVFQGSFSMEAAEKVAGGSFHHLVSLSDKSWLRQSPADRFGVYSLLRQYAAQRLALDADLVQEVNERHSAYYLAFVAERADALTAEGIQQDLENIHAAWQWAAENARWKNIKPLPPLVTQMSRHCDIV